MKLFPNIFFTSDWHLFHENVIPFSNRPFNSVEEMHRTLVKKYNNIVPESSICYFLGDMGFCSPVKIKPIVESLKGTKILILGNHDKKMHAMYKCGFDVVLNSASIYIGNERVTMSHCPLPGIIREDITGMKGAKEGEHWHGESRHSRFQIPNEGQFHLHGHLHSPNRGKSQKILGRQMDVGVNGNNYEPVSLSQIESWVDNTKKEETKDP